MGGGRRGFGGGDSRSTRSRSVARGILAPALSLADIAKGAVDALFGAMAGWRATATHLVQLSHDEARQEAAVILAALQKELRSPPELGDPGSGFGAAPARWMANPTGLQRFYEAAARRLIKGGNRHPLYFEKSSFLSLFRPPRPRGDCSRIRPRRCGGMVLVLNALALLVGDPARSLPPAAAFAACTWPIGSPLSSTPGAPSSRSAPSRCSGS